ncbi:MAG: GH25 family lysozyme [Agathobacter sp.]|nr:GH25 family lysozyme [Agathobacter sp.]
MLFSKKTLITAGAVLLAALCLSIPQKATAEVTGTQMDGVMGQSMEDETVYDVPSAGAGCFSLMAAGYDEYIANAWTTQGEYTSATYYHREDLENRELINGIDVSWWQSKVYPKTDPNYRKITGIDWEKAHADGIDFAFVRVASRDTADGSIYTDTSADSHIHAALENDISIGLYIFSQALNEKEAREEADYVIDLMDEYGWNPTLPIVMDRENGSSKRLVAGKLSQKAETDICIAFADEVRDAGYNPMIYSNSTWYVNYIDSAELREHNCGVWLARYNNKTDQKVNSVLTYEKLAAIDYEFWQYSSKGKVDGYTGDLDMDFWYKDTAVETGGLTVKNTSCQSVSLSWDKAADDVSGYRIYRYDPDQDKYVYLKSTSRRSYTDTTVTGGKEYRYKVRCYWTIGGTNYYGKYSSAVSAVTPPEKVENISTDKVSSTYLTLSWEPSEGAGGYRIYMYDEDSESYKKVADIKGETSCTITGLSAAREYLFKVKPYIETDNETLWGTSSSAYAESTKPLKVADLKISTVSSTELSLSWKKVEGAAGYQIYRLNPDTGKYEKIETIKNPDILNFSDQKRSTGTEYSYKVRAYKEYNGENYYGAFSDIRKMTTKPGKVKKVKLSTKSSSVTLSWSVVKGATGYQVFRLNSKTGKYEKIATVQGGTNVKYKDSKRKKGTTETYKVRAYKRYDESIYWGTSSPVAKIKVK